MSIIIASAQMEPKDEDIDENLTRHYELINLAISYGAKLILFPELSITGYVRASGKKLAFTDDDARLDELRKLANTNNIIIIAGAPITISSVLHIGSFVIYPDKTVSIYTKQFLHTGEDEFYASNFDYNPLIHYENERISLAICADISNPFHAKKAGRAGTTLYLAGIFYTPKAMTEAYEQLQSYAKKHSMTVMMSNYCGESWGLLAGGKSGLWSKDGVLIASADDKSSGVLIGVKAKDSWSGYFIKA